MPLPLPNLDDRTFDDLVAEARAMIPRLAPEWTQHNSADPGITLIELFAWLSELMLYRLNRVTEDHYAVFLQLLGAVPEKGETVESAVARALRSMQKRSRAVSLEDFEQLVLELPRGIARAKALAPRNLEKATPGHAGHVSVVILPKPEALEADFATVIAALSVGAMDPHQPINKLRQAVAADLEAYRLLTTVIHVVAPEFKAIRLGIKVAGRMGVDSSKLRGEVEDRLREFADPYKGGEEGTGWPFGLAVRRFEILQQVEAMGNVDHVESLSLNDSLQLNEILLDENQLPNLDAITVEST